MKHTLISILFIAAVSNPCSAQWKDMNFGGNVFAFGVHDSILFAGGTGSDGTLPYVYRFNLPASWTKSDNGIDFTQGNVTSFASLGRYFYAGIENHLVYRLIDDSAKWNVIDTIGSPISAGTKFLYAVDPKGIARSLDSGLSWIWTGSALSPNTFAVNGTCVFANAGSAIWRSTDTGNNWTQIHPPFIGTMTPMDSLLFIVGNGSVAKSTDSGTDWSMVTVDSAGVSEKVNCLATDGKNLFAGTPAGLLVSTDTGHSWTLKNDGLNPAPNVTLLAVFDTFVVAQVNYNTGLSPYHQYLRPIRELTGPSDAVALPPTGDSIEIYPNPTTAQVSILAGGTSILGVRVLNVLGSETGSGFRGPGSGNVMLDLSKLPSGTYFIEIQTSKGVQLRKISIER